MLKQLRLYGLTQKKRNTLCTVLLVILLIYVFTWIQRPTTSVREYYTPLTSKLSPCMVSETIKAMNYRVCKLISSRSTILFVYLIMFFDTTT